MFNCIIIGESSTVCALSKSMTYFQSILTHVGTASTYSQGLELLNPEKFYLLYIEENLLPTEDYKSHIISKNCYCVIISNIFSDKQPINTRVNYLKRPITKRTFADSMEGFGSFLLKSILDNPPPTEDGYFEVKFYTKGLGDFKIPYSDLLYVKSWGNYIHIHDINGSFFEVRTTLKACQEILPISSFSRIHNSVIVNHNEIEAIKGDWIYMKAQYNAKFRIGDSFKSILFDKEHIKAIRKRNRYLSSKNPYLSQK